MIKPHLWHHSEFLQVIFFWTNFWDPSNILERFHPRDFPHWGPRFQVGAHLCNSSDLEPRSMFQDVSSLWNGKTHGYESIPIHTIFRGMNIHLPAILMFTRGTRVLTHPHMGTWELIFSGRFSSFDVLFCETSVCRSPPGIQWLWCCRQCFPTPTAKLWWFFSPKNTRLWASLPRAKPRTSRFQVCLRNNCSGGF